MWHKLILVVALGGSSLGYGMDWLEYKERTNTPAKKMMFLTYYGGIISGAALSRAYTGQMLGCFQPLIQDPNGVEHLLEEIIARGLPPGASLDAVFLHEIVQRYPCPNTARP